MTETLKTFAPVDFAPHVRRVGDLSHLDLVVIGARCGGCLAKIERGLSELPSVRQARMNLSTSRLHVAWDGAPTKASQIADTLKELGFESGPIQANDDVDIQHKSETRTLLLCMAVAAFGLMNVMMLSVAVWSGGQDMATSTRTLLHMISAVIALPVAAFSGRPFFRSAWRALRAKQANMNVPISLAILLACGLSVFETALGNEHAFFDAALMLIFLLLIGRFLDAKLRQRTGQAARELAALQQVNARRIDAAGQITDIPADMVRAGDTLLIPSGSRIPVDVNILSGSSTIDAAIVTGEPVPQAVGVGDMVYSGCLNLGNPLTVEAVRAADDSFLSEITELIEAGQQSQAKYVRLADRAARAYVPIVHSLALSTFFGWLLVGGTPRTAILNAIAVLIITCPCALGLAVPAVQVVAVGKLFKAGIVVKTGHALERLSEITSIIFDKTGTLTQTSTVGNLDSLDPEDLTVFAALSQHSTHPATSHLRPHQTQTPFQDVVETAGQGISGFSPNGEVRIGQKSFVTHDSTLTVSGLWGWIEGNAPVELTADETLRAEIPALLKTLKDNNHDIHIVSGDAPERAESLAKRLGVASVHARITPAGKSDFVIAQQAADRKVLMVGDGINDAPALSHAHASVALASGTGISRAAADIVLRGDTLSGLPYAIKMARAARRAVLQNFAFAAAYNLLAIPLAVLGLVTPLIAAVAMSLSSILVTLNALKLNRIQPDGPIS